MKDFDKVMKIIFLEFVTIRIVVVIKEFVKNFHFMQAILSCVIMILVIIQLNVCYFPFTKINLKFIELYFLNYNKLNI